MKINWLHNKNKKKSKMVKACPNCNESMYYLAPNTMTHIIISNGSVQNVIVGVDDIDEELEANCFGCDIYFNPITGEIRE